PDDALEQLVAAVSGSLSIPVQDEDAPALQLERQGSGVRVDPELPPEEVAAPVVVVAGQIIDAGAGPGQLVEAVQDVEVALGEGRAEVEPEVEEVPHHDEARHAARRMEEAQEAAAAAVLPGAPPEVGVRHEQDAVVQRTPRR